MAGRALVCSNKKYSLIDKTGKVVLALNADVAFTLGANYIVIKRDKQYSLISRNGKFVRNLKYDEIYYPADGLASVIPSEARNPPDKLCLSLSAMRILKKRFQR